MAALKEKLETVPGQSIAARTPGGKKVPKLPFVFVYTPEFTFEDTGLDGEGIQVSDLVEESRKGDGKTATFKLSRRAQNPLESVEAPSGGQLVEGVDFTVNYAGGKVSFKTPPEDGVAVTFRYLSVASARMPHSVRIKVVCFIEVWGEDEAGVDDILLEVIKGVVLSQDALSAKGIQLVPSKGYTLGLEDGLPEEIFAQRVVYTAEMDLEAKEPIPRIESVEIRHNPPL